MLVAGVILALLLLLLLLVRYGTSLHATQLCCRRSNSGVRCKPSSYSVSCVRWLSLKEATSIWCCSVHTAAVASCERRAGLRPVTMETRCCQKKLEVQKDTRQKISVPLAMSINLRKKKSFKLFQNPKKLMAGQILGQDRPEKNSVKC